MAAADADPEPLPKALRDPYALTHAFIRAVCAIVVETEAGQGIGTGFHIGQGYVVTASHVLGEAIQAETLFHSDIPPSPLRVAESFDPSDVVDRWTAPEPIDLAEVLHHAGGRDAALFRSARFAANNIERTRRSIHPQPEHLYDRIPLNPPMDDLVGEGMLMLQGVVLGFPPIPFSREPVLVAQEFRVSAVIDRYDTRRPAFVLSGIPRGGFSGAPAIIGGGWALGIITEALQGMSVAETVAAPYLQTISLDPVIDLLRQAGVRPQDLDPSVAPYIYDD